MSDYREECIKHKLVQRGIVEQRPVTANKPKLKGDWLIVYFSHKDNRWSIWHSNGYRSEEDARKSLRSISFWYPLVVERSIFNDYYKNYRL